MLDAPKPFRIRQISNWALATVVPQGLMESASSDQQYPIWTAVTNATMETLANHDSHPDFLHLAGLVSEAVLEVVFVALPGFLVALSGMFDAKSQKFVAELNTMVFTPCLIFTKLAGQLNAGKLADLAVIPFLYAAQTLISWLCAQAMASAFGFGRKDKKMQKNFILAMSVFGNSNSLPISLVLSLSKTIKGLHWNQIPGDNDDEVGARGILYLLIFQQLGQLLRWTWGYSVLLKPASEYDDDERYERPDENRAIEEGPYTDEPEGPRKRSVSSGTDSGFNSGAQTPYQALSTEDLRHNCIPACPANGNNISTEPRKMFGGRDEEGGAHERLGAQMTAFPSFSRTHSSRSGISIPHASRKAPTHCIRIGELRMIKCAYLSVGIFFHNMYHRLPMPMQNVLSRIHRYNTKFWTAVWRQMNPPLWAMLAALVVASVPSLQKTFFTPGTLVNNSITRAISQSGSVAVPLILVVLGANLARSTIPKDQLAVSPEQKAEEQRLLWASLLSRMVLPVTIMAPLLALTAKYIPISILGDPIFIIVCFLLTGAPSALQLAQICQINNVFMGAMSSLLFASYVIAIFPSTLLLVLMALEVLEWAILR